MRRILLALSGSFMGTGANVLATFGLTNLPAAAHNVIKARF